jgi:hypothetical protein
MYLLLLDGPDWRGEPKGGPCSEPAAPSLGAGHPGPLKAIYHAKKALGVWGILLGAAVLAEGVGWGLARLVALAPTAARAGGPGEGSSGWVEGAASGRAESSTRAPPLEEGAERAAADTEVLQVAGEDKGMFSKLK